MKKPADIKFKVYCISNGLLKKSRLTHTEDAGRCLDRIQCWIEDNCCWIDNYAHPDSVTIRLYDGKREICTYFWDKTDAQPDFWDAWHDVESVVEAAYAYARAKKWWKVF